MSDEDNKTVYSVDDYADFVEDGDWTPAFQEAFDAASQTEKYEHIPGFFGIACWRCGKRMKSHPECHPNRRLDPARMHPLTSVVLLGWMMGFIYYLMAVAI